MAGRSEGLNLLSFVPRVTVPPRTAIMPSISSNGASVEESDDTLLQASSTRANNDMVKACFMLLYERMKNVKHYWSAEL